MLDLTKTDLQRRILELLADGMPRTTGLIAGVLVEHPAKVTVALFFLLRRGVIHHIPAVILDQPVEFYAYGSEPEIGRNNVA